MMSNHLAIVSTSTYCPPIFLQIIKDVHEYTLVFRYTRDSRHNNCRNVIVTASNPKYLMFIQPKKRGTPITVYKIVDRARETRTCLLLTYSRITQVLHGSGTRVCD